MIESRRSLMKTATRMGGVLLAGIVSGGVGRAAAQTPKPMPSPNAPTNQNVPAGMDGPGFGHGDRSPTNPLNQEQIAAKVHELYKLAGELKDVVEHTDLRATFPLDFVKKAQQAEKLAKQIKDLAKG